MTPNTAKGSPNVSFIHRPHFSPSYHLTVLFSSVMVHHTDLLFLPVLLEPFATKLQEQLLVSTPPFLSGARRSRNLHCYRRGSGSRSQPSFLVIPISLPRMFCLQILRCRKSLSCQSSEGVNCAELSTLPSPHRLHNGTFSSD